MNFNEARKGCWNHVLSFIISVFLIINFLSIYCNAEEVKGIKISSENMYQTSLGTLKSSFLLQNGNKVKKGSSGNLMIILGFIHIGSDEGFSLSNNVEIFKGKTNLSPNITFVQDIKSNKWVATNGIMVIDKDSIKLLDKSTIKIIDGKDNPVEIAGQSFADTTVIIENGKPIELKSTENSAKTSDLYDQKIIDAGRKIAKKLKLNPIPIFTNKSGTLSITKGTLFSIENNQWVLKDGDMVINAGNKPVKIEGISLNRGEYATIKNHKARKGSDNLISE